MSSTATPQLSLAAAILINLNIMLGSGIFINGVLLANKAGALGAAVYPLVALLILPLIASFSYLLSYIPGGTFFEFGKLIHPLVGFLSSWGYFVGKLASAALSMHVFVTLMQQISPTLAGVNALFIDACILSTFMVLNMFNVKTGQPIQYGFIIMKSIPVTIALYAAARLFDGNNFTTDTLVWSGIPSSVPFVLFAFAGFEASCSLSKNIKNSRRNGPLAILISYAIVVTVVTLYQFGLFGALGAQLGQLSGFHEPFKLMIPASITNQALAGLLTTVAFIGIASSALGASYGILYSNVWNLHTLAGYQALPGSRFLRVLNKFQAPVAAIIVAGIIEYSYLLGSGGVIRPLQQIAAFASTLTYTITALAFAYLCFSTIKKHRFIALCSIASCGLLLYSTLQNAICFGCTAYIAYSALLVIGIMGFLSMQKIASPNQAQTGAD